MYRKTRQVLKAQMENIYSMYGRGFGTKTMLKKCEDFFYDAFVMNKVRFSQ